MRLLIHYITMSYLQIALNSLIFEDFVNSAKILVLRKLRCSFKFGSVVSKPDNELVLIEYDRLD